MTAGRLDGADLEVTKGAHEALLSAYASVWDEVSRITSRGELVDPAVPGTGPGIYAPLPPLVRYFVESHVRGQLRELRAVYVRLQHTRAPAPFATRETRAWVQDAAADAAGLVDALPRRDWMWEALLAGVTLVPGSVIAWLFEAQWRVDAGAFARMPVGFLIGVAVHWALTTTHRSFDAKRRLFEARPEGRRLRGGGSIYAREDELFGRLGRPKRLEFPVDAVVSIATLLVAAGVSLVSALNGFRLGHVGGGLLLVGLAIGCLAVAAPRAQRARHRAPR
jgi:hypothetical protein